MGYALLWIEELAFWLCFLALGVALASRVERRSVRWLIVTAALSVPLLFLGAIAALTGMLEYGKRIHTGVFTPVACLLALILIGAAVLIVRGLSRGDQQRRQAAGWGLRPLALTTVGALLIHAMTFWNLDLAVRQQMDALRVEAGALATSVAPPRAPDRENAAPLYQQAFEGGLVGKKPANYDRWLADSMQGFQVDPASAPGSTKPFDPRDPEFVDYVKQNSEICRLLREAAARPSCNFSRDWSRPSYSMLIQETQHLRDAARELQLEAHFLAPTDLSAAFQNIVAMHRIADHIGQEPLMVSLLVSCAIESMAVGNLETLLQQYPVDHAQLGPAGLGDWRPAPTTPRLQRALRMEEAFGLAAMCQIAQWRDNGQEADAIGLGGWPSNASAAYRVFLLGYDVEAYRGLFQKWHNASMLGYPERRAAISQIKQTLKSQPGGIIASLLFPGLEQVTNAAARTDARQRLAQLGIAAHRYRIDHGDFPESIDELVRFSQAVYAYDPFSTELLKMTRRDGQVILYSVGPDLVDDGGKVQSPESTTYDITFVLKAA